MLGEYNVELADSIPENSEETLTKAETEDEMDVCGLPETCGPIIGDCLGVVISVGLVKREVKGR